MTDTVPTETFLTVRDLGVRFRTEDGAVQAVDGLSFELRRGRTLGIVGESGSGKSVTSLAILGLHDPARTTLTGSIVLDGQELVGADEPALRALRGSRMAMVFQDALTALSPYYTVGEQIAESFRRHTGASRREARARAVELLGRVGIPSPARRAEDHPHQFSGGMRQRAMIACALVCDPELLIADEPTTALDVTVQAQILDLLSDLQREFGTAIILITHDLGVVAGNAHDALVMYAGRCVEQGSVEQVLTAPRHPYTAGLLSSVPRLHGDVGVPLTPVRGNPPGLLGGLPPGCAFRPRCDHAQARCGEERPLLAGAGRRLAACHFPLAADAVDRVDPADPTDQLETSR